MLSHHCWCAEEKTSALVARRPSRLRGARAERGFVWLSTTYWYSDWEFLALTLANPREGAYDRSVISVARCENRYCTLASPITKLALGGKLEFPALECRLPLEAGDDGTLRLLRAPCFGQKRDLDVVLSAKDRLFVKLGVLWAARCVYNGRFAAYFDFDNKGPSGTIVREAP